MSTGASELLRSLGAGLRPAGIDAAGKTSGPARAGSGAMFADLLASARAGEISSGAPVTIAKGAGVELSEDQLRRLSIAVDRAEASGATRALVMIDGMALRVDVGVRQVTGRAELAPGAALSGIDGIVQAPDAEAGLPVAAGSGPGVPAVAGQSVPGSSSGLLGLNPSLIRALSARAGG